MQKSKKCPGKNSCTKPCEGEEEFDLQSILSKTSFDKRLVYIWEDVDDEMALSVNCKVNTYLDKSITNDITFVIQSGGGYIDSMSSILDDMTMTKKYVNVNTIVLGYAYSAAASILIHGTKGRRFARPRAKIMFHPMSYGIESDYAQYQKRYNAFIEKQDHLKDDLDCIDFADTKARNKMAKEMEESLWLTAEDAIKLKIIDGIHSDTLSSFTTAGK